MTFEINTSLFETGPVVILSWDGALIENTIHPMLFASPNVVKLLGYSVEELLNRSIEYGDIIHSDDIGRVVKTIEANQDAGILSFSDQYRVRKKNGEYIWVSDHTQYVLDDAGKTVRMDGYITDITDLVETRQKAEQARIERLAAERFSKNKSQFLANMSHEIRTPMNGVIGMVDILSRSDLDGRQSDIVQTIIRSGNALVRIINDILEFSKLESGKIILDSEPFNLSEAIFDVVQLLRVSIDEEAIDLLIRVDPEIASVALGDVGRFRQILMNLIGNAIKFTEKGHVLIYMTADKGPDDIVHYKIDVQDTGIGIAEDKLHDIFHSFNQADNSTTRQFGGTGLGLSIARDLARLMGGDITVSSALGQGATFSFTFKLHCVDEAHGKTGLQRGKLIENATKSVIVLDDNRVNLDILEEQLKHLGYESFIFDGPEGAIKAIVDAKHGKIAADTLILDYQMPVVDGEKLYRKLYEKGLTQHLRIIVLTSVDGDELRVRLLNMGVEKVLTKPISIEQLKSVLCCEVQYNTELDRLIS